MCLAMTRTKARVPGGTDCAGHSLHRSVPAHGKFGCHYCALAATAPVVYAHTSVSTAAATCNVSVGLPQTSVRHTSVGNVLSDIE